MGYAATARLSRRSRIYPTTEQKATLRLWFDASRWCYNRTIELLTTGDEPPRAQWKGVKTEIIHSVPERLKAAPYQVKSIAVRDACLAVSALKRRNRGMKRGQPGFAKASFRSRKYDQNCFIPSSAVKPHGVYPSILGHLRMAEPIPEGHKDSRLVLSHGRYHLAAPAVAQRRVSETQGRVAALDPGIRSFLTWFSEDDAGHIGKGDFGRIQRLCAHLDDLLSRASKAGHQRKRNMHRAADRLRLRIRNLVEELHHKAARYLVDNYDVILIPRFESSDMVRRGARRLRRKSVRNLLTFAHYRFRSFLQWKAEQMGKTVLVVNEAYTSKTCSWSGEMIGNLGGRKVVTGSDGVRLDRDINGARGIFLRALGDTPLLNFGLSRCNTPSGSVLSGLTTTQELTDVVGVC